MVARYAKQKDHATLLRAVGLLRERGLTPPVLFAGGGKALHSSLKGGGHGGGQIVKHHRIGDDEIQTARISGNRFGLAPLVLIPGAGTELYRGLGAIVLFGLAFSAVVTLCFLPALLVTVLGRRERRAAAQ